MAFTVKHAEENYFSTLPTNITDELLTITYNEQAQELRHLTEHFSYNLDNERKMYLMDKGIRLSPIQIKTHPHPLSKTIENHFLFNVVVNYFPDNEPAALISMKEEKARYMWARKTTSNVREMGHRLIDVRDPIRYKNVDQIIGGGLNFKEFCKNAKKRFNQEGKRKTKNFFFHDEGHHWSLNDLSEFIYMVNPDMIIMSVVFPIEVLDGLTYSHNTLAYSFEIHDDLLYYWPDSKKGMPYVQKAKCPILKIKNIKCHNQMGEVCDYYVTMTESIGAQHIVVIRKGNFSVESQRFFNDFDCIDLRKLQTSGGLNEILNMEKPILRKWVLRKVFSYLICLKKKDVESALAKLRQLSDSTPYQSEILLIGDLASLLMDSNLYKFESEANFFSFSGVRSFMRKRSRFLRRFLKPNGLDKITITRSWLLEASELEVTIKLKSKDLRRQVESSDKITTEIQKDYEGFKAREIINCNKIKKFSMVDYKIRNTKVVVNDLTKTIKGKTSKIFKNNNQPVSDYDRFNEAKSGDIIGLKGIIKVLEKHEPNKNSIDVICGHFNFRRPDLFHDEQYRIMYAHEIRLLDYLPHHIREAKESNSNIENLKYEYDVSMMGNIGKNRCFIESVANAMNIDPLLMIKQVLMNQAGRGTIAFEKVMNDIPLNSADMTDISVIMNWRIHIYYGNEIIKLNDNPDLEKIELGGRPGHIFNIGKGLSENHVESYKKTNHLIESLYGKKGNSVKLDRITVFDAFCLYEAFFFMKMGLLVNKESIKSGNVLSQGVSEVMLNPMIRGLKSFMLEKPIDIELIAGFAGSGKSRSLINILTDPETNNDFTFISTRSIVIEQINQLISSKERELNIKMSDRRKRFQTFEKALLKDGTDFGSLLVLDESSQLAPGYLDLILLKDSTSGHHGTSDFIERIEDVDNDDHIMIRNGSIKKIIMTGDPLQMIFHSDVSNKLAGLTDPFNKFVKKICSKEKLMYLFGTRRFGRDHPISLGFYADLKSTFQIKQGIPVNEDGRVKLVASHEDKRKLKANHTIGESQGSTFDDIDLIVTKDLFLCDLRTLITGITRHRYSLHLYITDDVHESINYLSSKNKELLSLLTRDYDTFNKFVMSKIECFDIIRMMPFGHDAEMKCENDPFLLSELSLVNPIKYDKVIVNEFKPRLFPKTHNAISRNNIDIEMDLNLKAREYREFKEFRNGWSSQFKDEPNSRDKVKINSAMMPEAIFPRHLAKDSLTFWAAVKKRLIFANPLKNKQRYEAAKPFGNEMLKLFLRYVPLNKEWNHEMYEDSILEFEDKKISKPSALIGSHSIRSDTDWPLNEIFLFIKSQLCTKAEKMFVDAKAGQTLACFSHLILIHFAPMARYIEKKVSESLPDRFYIHQKKDFCELEDWVLRRSFDGLCTESDYEAYDNSQDAYSLAFEVALMEHLGFKSSLIDDYKEMKFNLNCKLGNLAIMRFTGEFCTFLFNTLMNMIFTFMTYDIRDASICFAGDDMCANRRMVERKDFNHILSKMTLKAKVEFTKRPTFCGWNLSKYGIVKKPSLLLARLEVMEQKSQIDQAINSYFLEFLYAYEKGDILFDILSEEELEKHYVLTRFFVKESKKLVGEASEKFHTMRENTSISFGSRGGVHDVSFGSGESIFSKLIGLISSKQPEQKKGKNTSGIILSEREKGNSGVGYSMSYENPKKEERKDREGINETLNSINLSILRSTYVKKEIVYKLNLFDELIISKLPIYHSTPLLCNEGKRGLNEIKKKKLTLGHDAKEDSIKKEEEKKKKREKGGWNLIIHDLLNYKRPKLGIGGSSLNIREFLPWLSIGCLSFQSENSLVRLRETMIGCTLTQLNQVQYIKMQGLLTQELSQRLKDFRTLLPSLMMNSMSKIQLQSHFSIERNYQLLSILQRNSPSYISEPFSSLLPVCSRSMTKSKEILFTMTPDLGTKGEQLKKLLSLISLKAPLISCIGQATVYPRLTRILIIQAELNSHSMIWELCKGLMRFSLTSVLYIALPITSIIRSWDSMRLAVTIRRYSTLAFLLSLRSIYRLMISSLNQTWRLCLDMRRSLREDLDFLEECGVIPDRGSILESIEILSTKATVWGQVMLDYLGQSLLNLRIKVSQAVLRYQLGNQESCLKELERENQYSNNMSLKNQLREKLRRGLRAYLWDAHIDPEDKLKLKVTVGQKLSEEEEVRKTLVTNHYIKYFFGNLAELGTSMNTRFPNRNIIMPSLKVSQTSSGENSQMEFMMNLGEVVSAVKAWVAGSADDDIRNMTLRQVAECFADEAMSYLLEDPRTRQTNIYEKQPLLCSKAPEVAFDFAGGISPMLKTRDRAEVISALTQRLFRTQGQKAVFEASGAVHLNFDG